MQPLLWSRLQQIWVLLFPDDDFLPFLREITEENGTILIFDEVITGFRLGVGGAQEWFGIKPDLSTFGKIVGGGMPMAIYGGRKDIMRNISRQERFIVQEPYLVIRLRQQPESRLLKF